MKYSWQNVGRTFSGSCIKKREQSFKGDSNSLIINWSIRKLSCMKIFLGVWL